jgi:hypothetical protein
MLVEPEIRLLFIKFSLDPDMVMSVYTRTHSESRASLLFVNYQLATKHS